MMSEGYRAVCPFCHTEIRGPHGGLYRQFIAAVKNLKTHWRISCDQAPEMTKGKKDMVAENSVTVVERI